MIPIRPLFAVALIASLAATGAEAHGKKPVPVPRPALAADVETIATTRAVPVAALKAAWTQYGPRGVLEVRAVVEGDHCPMLVLDLERSGMQLRARQDANFSMVCAAQIPAGTKQAALAFPDLGHPVAPSGDHLRYDIVPLPLPTAAPQRILVLGDTGCRIKGTALQDCSTLSEWPFARVAAEAAKLKPDLVIHVGDYLYREQACPADFKGCRGTPFGDNWPTWDADFFAPAKPLLLTAPWVIVRGNHEDCARAGPGFLRLLGPGAVEPEGACSDHLAPYSIPFTALNLVVTDNADAPEQSIAEKTVPTYQAEIANLANEKAPTWWLLHRPIWGVISGPLGVPVGGNRTMMAGLGDRDIPSPVELMLSGHIHAFQVFNYEAPRRVPPQLVVGHGGDILDVTPTNLRGSIFQGHSGVGVKDGLSIGGFGFILMTRIGDGWRIDVYDWQGAIIRVCQFHNGRIDCPVAKR